VADGMKLMTYLCPLPRLRVSGAVPAVRLVHFHGMDKENSTFLPYNLLTSVSLHPYRHSYSISQSVEVVCVEPCVSVGF
jgi:hypothetical protein